MKYSLKPFFILVVFFSINCFGKTEVLVKGTKIYSKPSFRSSVIATLKQNTKLKIYNTKTSKWYRVIYKGKKGYVTLKLRAGVGGSASSNKKEGLRGKKGSSRGKAEGSTGSLSRSKKRGGKQSGQRAGQSRVRKGGASAGSAKGGGRLRKARSLTRADKVKAAHDAARRRAEASNQKFCSQCWYAKHGVDVGRYENTHPKFGKDGTLIPAGEATDTSGGQVKE